jgi:Ca-activated chloride channel family protein
MNGLHRTIRVALMLSSLLTGRQVLAAGDGERQLALEINKANGLLRGGDVDGAMKAYHQVQSGAPERADLSYNMAVAQYRKGDMAAAEGLFKQASASENDALAAKARYNLGNCNYAAALRSAESDHSTAIKGLEKAIENYRSALEIDPNDADSRANIELASAMIDKLGDQDKKQREKQQKQQNQKQQGQKQQPSKDKQDQKNENNKQQDNQEKKDSQQQNKDQKQSQQNEQQKPDSSQDKKSQGEQNSQDKQQQKKDESSKNQSGDKSDPKSQEQKSKEQESKSEQKDSKSQPQEQTKKDSADQKQGSKSQDQSQQSPDKQQSKSEADKQADQSQQQKQQRQSQASSKQKPKDQRPEQDEAKQSEQAKDQQGKAAPTGALSAADEKAGKEDPKSKETVGKPEIVPDGAMTTQEAEKMLQAIRDQEMLRRLRRQATERNQHVPVDRDW